MGNGEMAKGMNNGVGTPSISRLAGPDTTSLSGITLIFLRTELKVRGIKVTGGIAVLKAEDRVIILPFGLLAVYKAFAILGAGMIDLRLLRC